VSLGWPAFVLCVLGLLLALWRRDTAGRRLLWLLLPALSYHLTFTAVVGYTYDRFLLPVFLLCGLAAGYAVSRLEQVRGAQLVMRAATIGALAYSVAYVTAVNVALLRDPRYDVETWLRVNAPPGATVGVVAAPEHAPRLDDRFTEFVDPTVDVIRTLGFDYLVVNRDWAGRYRPGRFQREGLDQLDAGTLKYQRVFEAHHDIRFAGMAFAPRFEAFGPIGYSILTKLDPPMVVFRRR
jgi:hypothetical protein